MRDLLSIARKTSLNVALGALFGLFVFGQAAEAANPLELNFWLSGPKYDGRVAPCESALGTITSQFQEKESDVMLNDGRVRRVHYSIIEDGGFAGYNQGVEWCVTGLDRNWAYNPACKAAGP